jgi:hypothetical protein
MSSTITGSFAPASHYTQPIKTNSPKSADVFKELTQAKTAEDYYSPSPAATVQHQMAESPVYGAAQSAIFQMQGLAQQAIDPSVDSDTRDALNTQFNDLKSQLQGLGIGTDTNNASFYPLDVAAGWALGGAISYTYWYLLRGKSLVRH